MDKSLFLPERIAESIEILRTFEPPDGYYLAFSGGKDSVVLYDIAVKSGVRFDSHYNITSADPPEVVQFIREHYPSVKMDRPGTTMWKLIEINMFPPTQIIRYCCKSLKEVGGEGRQCLVGIKMTDSHKRRNRAITTCRKNGKVLIKPLFHWNDAEIWEHIRNEGILYCKLYDEGFTRLGCVACPFSGPDKQRRDLARWPKYRAAYIRAFDRMLKARAEKGMATTLGWQTGEDVMRWWLKEEK